MQVEQIDREAAAKVAVLVEMRELILAGKADHHAEPFAAHCHQCRAEVVREIVAWLNDLQEGRTSDNYPGYYARQIEAKFGGHE